DFARILVQAGAHHGASLVALVSGPWPTGLAGHRPCTAGQQNAHEHHRPAALGTDAILTRCRTAHPGTVPEPLGWPRSPRRSITEACAQAPARGWASTPEAQPGTPSPRPAASPATPTHRVPSEPVRTNLPRPEHPRPDEAPASAPQPGLHGAGQTARTAAG